MKRLFLGEFEELTLLTVAALEENAYGVTIMHEIIEQTGRSVRLNQVHSALQRLEDKGMVKSKMGNPTCERGGRRKRLFVTTALGKKALADIQSVRQRLWHLAEGSLGKLSKI
jgi:PadR family transcriptional regulator, regulatory protein PadR